LIAFGADIFLVGNHENIRFWTNGSDFDAVGVDYLLKTRRDYYIRRQQERTLKKGDRVAVFGYGIAVVEDTDEKEALVVVGKRLTLRIALKDIEMNWQNNRWECEANSAGGEIGLTAR
jgi:preprotein translocase subunit YajC